jgi:hypothetical protein
MTQPAPAADLHALAQALVAASLSVDAARLFLERGETARLHDCLGAAAEALLRGGAWIEARRQEEAEPSRTPPQAGSQA